MLDRLVLRRMGCTVCVSEAQAVRVRRAGVPPDKITVIRNAVGLNQDDTPDPRYRNTLLDLFERPPTWLVAAAGRFSPEKGFDHFVEAAAVVRRTIPDAGFVLFGDGPLRGAIARKIAECGLEKSFILAGFRRDLQAFLPHFDLAVLPSYTEGLPVFVLEAMAAGVPVVATAVGGTPEAVVDGITGHLVPPGDPVALAARVVQLLQNESQRRRMGACGQQRVEDHFTFAAQCAAYQRLFDRMAITRHGSDRSPVKSLEHSVHA
jgi:glycosyltransferase involved in cell wall biosynthesis